MRNSREYLEFLPSHSPFDISIQKEKENRGRKGRREKGRDTERCPGIKPAGTINPNICAAYYEAQRYLVVDKLITDFPRAHHGSIDLQIPRFDNFGFNQRFIHRQKLSFRANSYVLEVQVYPDAHLDLRSMFADLFSNLAALSLITTICHTIESKLRPITYRY